MGSLALPPDVARGIYQLSLELPGATPALLRPAPAAIAYAPPPEPTTNDDEQILLAAALQLEKRAFRIARGRIHRQLTEIANEFVCKGVDLKAPDADIPVVNDGDPDVWTGAADLLGIGVEGDFGLEGGAMLQRRGGSWLITVNLTRSPYGQARGIYHELCEYVAIEILNRVMLELPGGYKWALAHAPIYGAQRGPEEIHHNLAVACECKRFHLTLAQYHKQIQDLD